MLTPAYRVLNAKGFFSSVIYFKFFLQNTIDLFVAVVTSDVSIV
jgi:hypothetical protein